MYAGEANLLMTDKLLHDVFVQSHLSRDHYDIGGICCVFAQRYVSQKQH